MFTVEIAGIPPSVNSCYVNGKKQGVRFKSQLYKDWEIVVMFAMKRLGKLPQFIGPLKVEIEVYRPDWWNMDMTAKKADISNRIKTLEDAVFKHLSVDDSLVWEVTARKMDSNEFKTVMKISEMIF